MALAERVSHAGVRRRAVRGDEHGIDGAVGDP
jgi:hypothetical protein